MYHYGIILIFILAITACQGRISDSQQEALSTGKEGYNLVEAGNVHLVRQAGPCEINNFNSNFRDRIKPQF